MEDVANQMLWGESGESDNENKCGLVELARSQKGRLQPEGSPRSIFFIASVRLEWKGSGLFRLPAISENK